MPFTQSDFESAASQLGCSWQAVAAVCQVESRGGGFCPDGFPKTLHEGHHFHRYTKGKFDASHPTLSYRTWTKAFYGKTWQLERARLEDAMKLDRTSAILSNSWGAFQIMGANYAACGCKTLQEFVNRMCKSEASQLVMFIEYIKFNRLDDELRELRFKDFARLYNGPGQVDTYGGRMEEAYRKLKGI
jgi:hypothetical protein